MVEALVLVLLVAVLAMTVALGVYSRSRSVRKLIQYKQLLILNA